MKYDRDALDWPFVALSPVGLLILIVPLVVALGHVTAQVPAGPGAAWAWQDPIRRAERALASQNAEEASRASEDAYRAAMASRQWQGMIEVGDLYLKIGDGKREYSTGTARARTAYLTALFRARRDRALEGVLRVADAFAALGDGDVAEHALRIAAEIADRGPAAGQTAYRHAAQRVRARIGATSPSSE